MIDLPSSAERLILVKHSLPEVVDGVRAREWRLGTEGRRRCDALADALAAYAPSGPITSSDEPKAIETAGLLAGRLGLLAAIDAGLGEHRRGALKLLDEAAWQEAITRLFAHPERLEYGEETGDHARQRFDAAVQRILLARTGAGGACVCVAHGTVISLFTAALTGADGHALWSRLGLPSFVVLERLAAGGWEIRATTTAASCWPPGPSTGGPHVSGALE